METLMRCPVDNETLVMADRGGVEIDYCPKCRGVWLDRGELDKIIERAAGDVAPVAASAPRPAPQPQATPVYQQEPPRAPQYREEDRRRPRDYDDDDDYKYGYGKKRKKSILGEIFDF
jgi:uncharacterized protein